MLRLSKESKEIEFIDQYCIICTKEKGVDYPRPSLSDYTDKEILIALLKHIFEQHKDVIEDLMDGFPPEVKMLMKPLKPLLHFIGL